MLTKLSASIQISRPVNFLITFFSISVAAVISAGEIVSPFIILFAALSGGFTASAGNIINDILDLPIDKINRPERVLPKEKLTKNEALLLYSVLNITALIFSVLVGLSAFLIVFFTIVLLLVYSFFLKKIPLLGNFVVAFLTGLAFIYGGIAVENISSAVIPALFAFLINFVREILKDMEDVEGDSAAGVKTYPLKYGFKKSKTIILMLTLLLIMFTFYPFLFNIYKIEYFIIVVVIVDSLLVYFLRSLYSDDSERNLEKLSNLLKLNMVFGLIAIFLGR